MPRLDPGLESRLRDFASALIDQQQARSIVPAEKPQSGFWFGGGNLTVDRDGRLTLVGRYRQAGDSRVGLDAGVRGWRLCVFQSTDSGTTFEPVLQFSKADLASEGHAVLSIEGCALRWDEKGVELFVSSEKEGIGYPEEIAGFLKPGCGVWTIDVLRAPTLMELSSASVHSLLASDDPLHWHVKDPKCYETARGDLWLLFCSHPFSWSSSNTGVLVRRAGQEGFELPRYGVFPRGPAWDVAIARGTCLLDVPRVGAFRDQQVSLLFYDGGECVRPLETHEHGVERPRGYSCEELGGVAYVVDGDLGNAERLSRLFPLFVSPWGTGCSRYVDVLATDDAFYATWQQSQPDGSQNCVLHRVDRREAKAILE